MFEKALVLPVLHVQPCDLRSPRLNMYSSLLRDVLLARHRVRVGHVRGTPASAALTQRIHQVQIFDVPRIVARYHERLRVGRPGDATRVDARIAIAPALLLLIRSQFREPLLFVRILHGRIPDIEALQLVGVQALLIVIVGLGGVARAETVLGNAIGADLLGRGIALHLDDVQVVVLRIYVGRAVR